MLLKKLAILSPSAMNNLVKVPRYATEWVLVVEYTVAAPASFCSYFEHQQ
jgi:hypothetical protein